MNFVLYVHLSETKNQRWRETKHNVWSLLKRREKKKSVAHFTGIVGIDCGTGATTMAVPAMKGKWEKKCFSVKSFLFDEILLKCTITAR